MKTEMKTVQLSVKNICLLTGAGTLLSMLAVTTVLYTMTGDILLLWSGGLLALCALGWLALLILFFGKRLSVFTDDLCRTLDNMISGNAAPDQANDSETLFARISHRLSRLYGILQENRRQASEERKELQMLVSDISHQVKTPLSNLGSVTDTLLTKPVTDQERREFLLGIRSQTDKLDFLFQALVKTSRLETGAVRLEKKNSPLYDTLAQAVSGIVYAAEKKSISVSVNCPEALYLFHDGKWTAEALFNLLDL